MRRVVVKPGIYGLSVRIKVVNADQSKVRVEIGNDCEMVTAMGIMHFPKLDLTNIFLQI